MNISRNNNSLTRDSSSEESLQHESLKPLGRDTKILDDSQDSLKPRELEMVPPDGGWGWFILTGSFLTMAFILFPAFGFGILLSPLFNKNVSSAKIAWSISIYGFVFHLFVLFGGSLNEEFGWRKVAIVGGILNSLSLLLSAFITNPDVVLFIYPILAGIGGGTGMAISHIVVSRYFLKRRGFAISITGLGVTLSNFSCPILANYLFEFYGFKSACLTYGALILNQCVGGALFQPLKWHMKLSDPPKLASGNNLKQGKLKNINSKQNDFQVNDMDKNFSRSKQNMKKPDMLLQGEKNISVISIRSPNSRGRSAIDLKTENTHLQSRDTATWNNHIEKISSVLKNIMVSTFKSILILKFMRMKLVCFGIGCSSIGNVMFQTWIPLVLTQADFSLELAAWCVSFSTFATLIGRLIITFISDQKWFNVKFWIALSSFSMALSIAAFSLIRNLRPLLFCLFYWGMARGIFCGVQPILLISISGEKIFPAIFGLASLSSAIMQLSLGPVVGIIRDSTSSYTYAILFMAIMIGTGSAALFCMPFAIKYDKAQIFAKTSEETHECLEQV